MNQRAGSVAFRVQHTARTWGADIQALLDGHLTGLLTPESKVKTFVRTHNAKIQTLTFAAIMACMLISSYLASQNLFAELNRKFLEIIAGNMSQDGKMNAILAAIYQDPWNSFSFYTLVYFILSLLGGIFVAVWMDSTLTRSKPSFLLLTPVAERDRKETLGRYHFQWYSFFGSMLFSVIAGLISSIIYANFWGK